MRYILFEIGPVTIYSYGLMIAIGFIAALGLCLRRAPRFGLDTEEVWNFWYICLIGGLLGAKLLYIIIEFRNIIDSTLSFSDIATGFVVYGGIIGGALSIYGYCRFRKLNFWKYIDLIAPAVPLAQGFGRIGCFLAGCCYGRPTDARFGVVFETSPFAPNSTSVIPTQLLSSLGDFAIAGIILWMASRKHAEGILGGVYFVLYGVGRFAIEFLRNDPRGTVGFLSTSQFISIFIVAVGIILIAYRIRYEKGQKTA